jgi:hypothetical protein
MSTPFHSSSNTTPDAPTGTSNVAIVTGASRVGAHPNGSGTRLDSRNSGPYDCLKYHWPLGRRPDEHPGLSDFGF